MKLRLFIGLLSLSVAFSCKNQSEENQTSEQQKPEQKTFQVELDVKAEKADDFALYYTQDNSINFDDKQVLWHPVKGGMVAEKVLFDVPEEILPTNVRIDFGIKKDCKEVTLEKIKFSFLQKSIEAKGSEFLYYFMPNEKVDAIPDMQKGTITFKKKAEFPDETYFYYPSPALNDSIKVLTGRK